MVWKAKKMDKIVWPVGIMYRIWGNSQYDLEGSNGYAKTESLTVGLISYVVPSVTMERSRRTKSWEIGEKRRNQQRAQDDKPVGSAMWVTSDLTSSYIWSTKEFSTWRKLILNVIN